MLASVADDESKQAFDAFVPPSSRGYIKSIVLQPSDPRTEDVTFFVRSVAAAKELRWPLTAAGDPYARPGSEVEIVGIVNALSYKNASETGPASKYQSASSVSMSSSSPMASLHTSNAASSLDCEPLAKEMAARVIVPLATIKALLPLLSAPPRPSSGSVFQPPSVVLSIVNPASSSDVAAHALLAGMKKLDADIKTLASTSRSTSTRPISITTLKVQRSSVTALFRSLFPSIVGGVAPTLSRPALVRSGSSTIGDGSLQQGRRPLDANGRIVEKTSKPSGAGRAPLSSSVADARAQRGVEARTVLQGVAALLLETSASSARLRLTYLLRLPAHADVREQPSGLSDTYESTWLFHVLRYATSPLRYLGHALSLSGFDLCELWNRGPGARYRGTRNVSNSKPAYGPGPGPASNTHSRSCIRQQQPQTQSQEQPAQRKSSSSQPKPSASQGAKPCRARPASTASTSSSSENARTSESEESRSGGRHSGPTSSAPPSNPDMSSSGLLSSVPSSAFGDGSEEEHLADSDFVGSHDSPAIGGRSGSDVGHYARTSSRYSTGAASSSSDGDDTALGARNYDTGSSANADDSVVGVGMSRAEDTPSASSQGSAGDSERKDGQSRQEEYGFPSATSMQSRGNDAPWMGPPSRGGSDSPSGPSSAASRGASAGGSSRGPGAAAADNGTDTPLGHSWVALGQSSIQQQPSERDQKRR